jgi:hypothetical protein
MSKAAKPSVSRESDKFMLRFPEGMRARIAERAKANGRSANSEIIAMLASLLDASRPDLAAVPPGELLDEVIGRYGARVQIVISEDVALQAGISRRE